MVTTNILVRRRLSLVLPSLVRKSVSSPLVGYVRSLLASSLLPLIFRLKDRSTPWYGQGQRGVRVDQVVLSSPIRFRLLPTVPSSFFGPKILYAVFYVYMMTMLCHNNPLHCTTTTEFCSQMRTLGELTFVSGRSISRWRQESRLFSSGVLGRIRCIHILISLFTAIVVSSQFLPS